MSELAPLSAPTNQWVTELARWEDMLTDADLIATAEMRDKARLVIEVVKIRNLAASISIAASRVEAQALRRLGQLDGGMVALKGGARTYAKYLAALEPERFAAFLEHINGTTRVGTLVNQMRNEELDMEMRGEITHRAKNNRWKSVDASITAGETRKAARALVHELFSVAQPTQIEAGARLLLDVLSVWSNGATIAASEAVVRAALDEYQVQPDNDSMSGQIGLKDVPPFIVVETDDGWVRIPQHKARVDQLRWVAERRSAAASEMMRDSDALLTAADRCQAIIDECGLPADTPLGAAEFADHEGHMAARYRGQPKDEAARRALAARQGMDVAS